MIDWLPFSCFKEGLHQSTRHHISDRVGPDRFPAPKITQLADLYDNERGFLSHGNNKFPKPNAGVFSGKSEGGNFSFNQHGSV